MGIPDVLDTKNQLLNLQCIDDSTPLVITHFSHNGHLLHDEIENIVAPYNITVAYDGLEVVF
jgi:phosphoribosyl 1,2-cyclic phosphate phosphodiesterase